jgi:hypothetical protein
VLGVSFRVIFRGLAAGFAFVLAAPGADLVWD